MSEALMDRVRAHMRTVKAPKHYDKVYKDECMFSFATPEAPNGLFINMQTWQAFSDRYVDLDHRRTGNALYLQEKWHKIPVVDDEADSAKKPEKMAIGVEGGFMGDKPKFTIEKEYALMVMPDKLTIPLPCPELPTIVLDAISAIQAHDSAAKADNVAVWEEERRVSKYAADLPQLDTGRRIDPNPATWKCDETGVTENLWLNLSTGFVGSGRANWDGTGGNGAALRHYEATGKQYPLVVKLGTITPHGADVYSYAGDEEDMVLDPKLAEHLQHWGINMMQMEKTEKTMAEMEIERNMTYEFDRITEAGAQLKPLAGPGYVGLTNLGNSCYMNSVVQALATLPEIAGRYVERAEEIFSSAPADAASDLPAQIAKLCSAMAKGDIGMPPEAAGQGEGKEGLAVKPQAFKSLVGRGHPEFSSARQQDVADYFQHLLELLARAEHTHSTRLGVAPSSPPIAAAFSFELEDRIQCMDSGCVSYRRQPTRVLPLDIPLEAAVNTQEVAEYRDREGKRQKLKVAAVDTGASFGGAGAAAAGGQSGARDAKRRKVEAEHAEAYIGQDGDSPTVTSSDREAPVIPRVPLAACLERFTSAALLEDYHSAALGRKGMASKRTRFASFPPYLVVQLKRYYVDKDWVPKKLEVLVDVPQHLDLEQWRGRGQQQGEKMQPEEQQQQQQPAAPAQAAAAAEPDPALVAQIMSMGFSENGSKRAVMATGNSNAEAAMEWVFAHMEDPDFNDPYPPPAAAGAAAAAPSAAAADPEQVSTLAAMGFTSRQAEAALQACGGNLERAADWLFSHMDDLDGAVEGVMAQAAGGAAGSAGAAGGAAGGAGLGSAQVVDGPGRYELLGFISHMGSNTACGHYVAHIKKDGRWVLFNDDKVAESEHPPLDMGYLYVFRRSE